MCLPSNKKIKYFQILFEKEDAIFYGGESIKGKVLIKCNTDVKINSVKIKAHGFGVVNM